MSKPWLSVSVTEENKELIRLLASAFDMTTHAYMVKIIEEDLERKKGLFPKLNKIAEIKEEIRQMEEERKRMETLIAQMMEKAKELKKLQEEVLSA